MKKLALLILAVSLSVHCLVAQSVPQSVNSLLKSGTQPPAASSASADPLGRATPSGTVLGFLKAAQDGNERAAADYLQMSAARRQSQGPDIAGKLKVLMDSAFVGSVRRISTSPEGDPNYGTSDQQTIGNFSTRDADVPVVLVRVTDPNAGNIWLFSAGTLSKVPDLYEQRRGSPGRKQAPAEPGAKRCSGDAALAVAGAFHCDSSSFRDRMGGGSAAGDSAPALAQVQKSAQPGFLQPPVQAIAGLFSALAHRVIAAYLGLPLLPRLYYYRTIGVLVSIGFFWFLLRFTGLTMQRLRMHAISGGRIGTGTLMVLAERLLTALVVVIATLAIFGILGFNLTTLLAGLGIGGLAIAFAAQKTLENLFGGISVLADEVIRVGDYCRFGDRTGTVEDISLRSTRVRTDARTELSIPNGTLATMSIENFTRRDKILFNPALAIRYETTGDQLRYLLAEIRRMLYEHPKVESDSASIRFANFDNSALRLEIFSYVLTRDANEFNAIREDLLLRIMSIVEKSGSGFAFPSQTMYFSRDSGIDKEKADAAEQQVQQWRDQHKLPFPDFAAADKSAFRGSIAYPEPESATGGNQRLP